MSTDAMLKSGFDNLTPDEVRALATDILDYLQREEGLSFCEERSSGNFAVLHPVYVPTCLQPEQLAEKYVRTRVVGERAIAGGEQ